LAAAHSPRWKKTSSIRPAEGAIGESVLSRAPVSETRACACATRASAARIWSARAPSSAASIRCRAASTRAAAL